MNTLHGNRGFTMLEVMISIVIIAFGLLGVAGLQAFALKNTQSANFRLTATTLANDMIDRMKSNHAGVSNGNYNSPDSGDYAAGVNCNGATPCTGALLADFDRAEWARRVRQALPGGTGIVCLDSTPNDGASAGAPSCDGAGNVMYVVKIWWADDRTSRGAAVAPQLFWTAFNP
jgi:type IV pilus assembly protein PilV